MWGSRGNSNRKLESFEVEMNFNFERRVVESLLEIYDSVFLQAFSFARTFKLSESEFPIDAKTREKFPLSVRIKYDIINRLVAS